MKDEYYICLRDPSGEKLTVITKVLTGDEAIDELIYFKKEATKHYLKRGLIKKKFVHPMFGTDEQEFERLLRTKILAMIPADGIKDNHIRLDRQDFEVEYMDIEEIDAVYLILELIKT